MIRAFKKCNGCHVSLQLALPAGVFRQAQPPGGTRQSHFDGTNFKPRKVPENAHAVPTGGSPTTMAPTHFVGDRVLAVLGRFWIEKK
jgi:hypothetical protein